MIQAAAILFSMVGISSLYGQMIIDNPEWLISLIGHIPIFLIDLLEISKTELFHPLTYHIPMVWFDMIVISLLKINPTPNITNPLVFILSLSIINHTFGAFSWAAYNPGYMYDFGRHAILGMEILVFIGGIFSHAIDRRRKDPDWPSVPGILFVESDECD